MEEEGGERVRLIVGIVVIALLVIAGFFVLRGFWTKKTINSNQSAIFPSPTIVENQYVSPTPTLTPTPTIEQGSTPSHQYYYYQSQSSQSQSQTLPNGMTQSQSQ